MLTLIVLTMGLSARAQDAVPSGAGKAIPGSPASRAPKADLPPPLNLGGAADRRGEPKSSQSDGKWSDRRRWSGYASALNKTVMDAVNANSAVKTALSSDYVEYELWIDRTGRVTRVRPIKSLGDNELDAALRDEVLLKLNLSAPESDMPMPVKGKTGKINGGFWSGISLKD
ncbi:hypothetical protein H8A95_01575 [Bradyrhizobium sp. Pear76]|uniref:hypothetical protein n=1 Tax=Bradyrhizobium oropedii TaxID=1571201 RepID=UPI001E4BA585|nr:hypothetical protein [Bradyrhizobium oropedii]MCC8961032.1 hypothetical protein [Bradyrhizobium oropedii]